MTQLWDDEGRCHPCTVIGFESPNFVTQKFSKERDGRDAIQVGYKEVPEKNIKKPEIGHCAKAGAPPLRHLVEWKVKDPALLEGFEVGKQVSMLELFEQGQLVDVAGVTIGKGTQGAIKRWGHAVGPMTHGSKSHREHGSIGSGSATPSRVLPGLKHAGHMGDRRVTAPKLKIFMLKDEEDFTALVVRGSVPGKPGALLEVTPTKTVGKNC